MTFVYFTRNDGITGNELWVSNGSASRLVKDISANGHSDPRDFVVVGRLLYFTADDGVNGRELWRSDGTASGTFMLRNITAGAGSSAIAQMTRTDDALYFVASDGIDGPELWRSDGTAAGTMVVRDINPSGGSSPSWITSVNGTIYFTASDGVNGVELWKTDGTEAGTGMVKDINPAGSSGPRALLAHDGMLYFAADDGASGSEIWRSDGTAAGTMMVFDRPPPSRPIILPSVSHQGGVYSVDAGFTGIGFQGSALLWRSDDSGTVLLQSYTSESSLPFLSFKPVGETLFIAVSSFPSSTLWKTDGTPAGTVELAPVAGSLRLFSSVVFKNQLFFVAGSQDQELWRSDGTTAGTGLLKDIPGAFSPSSLTPIGDALFFFVGTLEHGVELWKTDGTAAGTVMVKDINPGAESASRTFANPIFEVDGKAIFRAYDGISWALWQSDGTSTGTVKVPLSDGFSFPESISAPFALASGSFGVSPPSDYDGDASTEILWRGVDGTVVAWKLAGGSAVNGTVLGQPEPEWKIVQSGDYNGDDISDILWRHRDGQTVAWLMDAAGHTSQGLAPIAAGLNIGESGDYNGDGISDILLRSAQGGRATGGDLTIRLLDGAGGSTDRAYGFISPVYRIVEAGDFNADGVTDILWRHDDGTVLTWLMAPSGTFESHTFAAPENAWQVQRTGDFNADGRSDILWQHADGTVLTWELNEAGGFGSQILGQPGAEWEIQDTGDVNGDGRSDLIWRNVDDERVVIWAMTGSTAYNSVTLDSAPNSSWQIFNDPNGPI